MATGRTQRFQTKPIPTADLGTGFAELLDLCYIVCRERRLNVLAHLLHVAGDQDGPATQRSQVSLQKLSVLGLLHGAREWEQSTQLSSLSRSHSEDGVPNKSMWEGGNPRLVPEGPRGVATLLPWKAAVGPHHLDSVTRFHFIHQIIV